MTARCSCLSGRISRRVTRTHATSAASTHIKTGSNSTSLSAAGIRVAAKTIRDGNAPLVIGGDAQRQRIASNQVFHRARGGPGLVGAAIAQHSVGVPNSGGGDKTQRNPDRQQEHGQD